VKAMCLGRQNEIHLQKKDVKIRVVKIVDIVHLKLCGPFNTKSK